MYKPDAYSIDASTSQPSNDFNYDLYTGLLKVAPEQEAQGLTLAPVDGAGGTPGHDAGARIANFNDGYSGTAPDMGAQEAGAPPLQFGVDAYR